MPAEMIFAAQAVEIACNFLKVRPEFIRAITRDVQLLVPKDSRVLNDLSTPVFTFKFDTAVSTTQTVPTDPYVGHAPIISVYFGRPGADFWGNRDGGIQVGKFVKVQTKEDYAGILKNYAAALKVAAGNTKAERYRDPAKKAHRDQRVAEFQRIENGVLAIAQGILDGKYDAEWEGASV